MSEDKYELFIRIHNGVPVFHPMTRENIETAYPTANLADPDSSPIRFEKAKLIPQPDEWIALERKVWEEEPYTFDGEYWVNGWHKRDMTEKERYETDIMAEIGDRRDKQIAKYLESVGLSLESPMDKILAALNEVGPDYVFSLEV